MNTHFIYYSGKLLKEGWIWTNLTALTMKSGETCWNVNSPWAQNDRRNTKRETDGEDETWSSNHSLVRGGDLWTQPASGKGQSVACYHLFDSATTKPPPPPPPLSFRLYSTIQLLCQVRPANNNKSGCLSSCAQCEVLLAGEEGGGAKLSSNSQHAARQLVSLDWRKTQRLSGRQEVE